MKHLQRYSGSLGNLVRTRDGHGLCGVAECSELCLAVTLLGNSLGFHGLPCTTKFVPALSLE